MKHKIKHIITALLNFPYHFKSYYMTMNQYINQPFNLQDTIHLWKLIYLT